MNCRRPVLCRVCDHGCDGSKVVEMGEVAGKVVHDPARSALEVDA